jgi:glucokinase
MAILAIDAGGTKIKLAAVENGLILNRTSLESRSTEPLRPRLHEIKETLTSLLPGDSKLEGIGLGFPSIIKNNRIVGDVGKFTDAETIDFSEWAEQEFSAPLFIENDARLATIGEWQYGAGRGIDNFVSISLGTGIGTGAIINGAPIYGSNNAAGILGAHMTADQHGAHCACGNIGCWETLASTAWLHKMCTKEQLTKSLLADGPLNFEAIFTAASLNDELAIRLKEESLSVWSMLTVSLIHAYDPAIVVFGGGVLQSGELILEPIRNWVRKHAWFGTEVQIVASPIPEQSALLACEWLVHNSR